jgi:hypothetical protein
LPPLYGREHIVPLDHYVPQVHLKNFYSPKLGTLMHTIRKSDLKSFTPDAQSVCRIEDDSKNSYLREDRIVEEFLKGIEPKYNSALQKLAADNIDAECIYAIAGFVAYVLTCSPAGMRIKSEPLKTVVEETARIVDSQGHLPGPPPELGGESLTDLLNGGELRVKIDHKFPQALGIVSILSVITAFGNFAWDVMLNSFDDNPFFTSDFPVAIEKTKDVRVLNRIVPLAPYLAIRIRPDLMIDRNLTDFSFPHFRYLIRKLSRPEVMSINSLIVRCAESIVFFRDDHKWIPGFVKRNSKFRIEPRTHKLPNGDGTLLWYTQEIIETRSQVGEGGHP